MLDASGWLTERDTCQVARTWTEPWIVHEDEHVLAVHKPSGVNTHRSDEHAQDGMYEWVQRQRPDSALSILHRLDKATSGVLVFGKTVDANRSLNRQFEDRTATKTYALLTAPRADAPERCTCDAAIDGASASTTFTLGASGPGGLRYVARPRTGRTHQVRIHAEISGIPVLGDGEHGGAAAARLFLHAEALDVEHPCGGALALSVRRPESFDRVLGGEVGSAAPITAAMVALEARTVLLEEADTDAHLWIDRHHDGFPGVRVERLGEVALVLDYRDDDRPLPSGWIDAWTATPGARGLFVQRRPRGGGGGPAQRVVGDAPASFDVRELGLRYRVDLEASATSTGLFLDQRETRRELLGADLRGSTVLNTFAHTGSLSVAAATAGAETLTLDLSKRYLDWARENLVLNGLDPAEHDFIYGDAIEWMERLAKKGRAFDVVLVDPPSASTARKGSKRWSVDRDLHALIERAARLTAGGGRVFASTNYRRMPWPRFLDHLSRGLSAAGRVGTVSIRTLPLDHRTGAGDPPYLKAAWIDLDG